MPFRWSRLGCLSIVLACAVAGCAPATAPTAGSAKPGSAKAFALDTALGTNGVSTLPLSASTHDRFMAVTVGADGKVYAAGYTTLDGDQAFAVARIDSAGQT